MPRYSYKFVELSIRNRQLEDLEDHTVGPPAGTARTIGSITRPAKGIRTAFTAEDDRVLFDWVTAFEQAGGKTAGNEIYKQLEQIVGHPHASCFLYHCHSSSYRIQGILGKPGATVG